MSLLFQRNANLSHQGQIIKLSWEIAGGCGQWRDNGQLLRLSIANPAQLRAQGFTGFSIAIRQPVSSGSFISGDDAGNLKLKKPPKVPLV